MPKNKKQKLNAIDGKITVLKQSIDPTNIVYDPNGDFAFVLGEVKFATELNGLSVQASAYIIFDDEIDATKKQNIQLQFEQHYRRLIQAQQSFGQNILGVY